MHTSYVNCKSDNISCTRDALSLQGRPDIKAQFCDRCFDTKSPSYIPKELIDHTLQFAETLYPGSTAFSLPQCKTSSFISCQSAVELQEKMYQEASSTIEVYNKETKTTRVVLFDPPWPTYFVHVHPSNDHGQRFHRVIEKDFGKWMFLCITGRVPELWTAISDAVVNNMSWHGHWLRYASLKLDLVGENRKCKHFPADIDVATMFPSQLGAILGSKKATSQLFEKCSKVAVLHKSIVSDQVSLQDLEDEQVIICLEPDRPNYNEEWNKTFELRCLICSPSSKETAKAQASRTMYIRHHNHMFWVQNGRESPCKFNGMDLDGPMWGSESGPCIAVYC